MASYNLYLLPGDGIGPEVMTEAEAIIAWMNAQGIARFETGRGLVGGPKWDKVPDDVPPEALYSPIP